MVIYPYTIYVYDCKVELDGATGASTSSLPIEIEPLVVTDDLSSSLTVGAPSIKPKQPNVRFPQRQFGKKYRAFNASWYSIFAWLDYCISRNVAFCASCTYVYHTHPHRIVSTKNEESVFYLKGFNNWKKAMQRFKIHEHSYTHAISNHILNSLATDTNVRRQLCKQKDEDMLMATRCLHHIFTSIQYLLKQGLALRGHNDLEGNLEQLLRLRAAYLP